MNPVSAFSWSWRALRGHSVTFAGLFASAVLGISILAWFKHLLVRLGAPWYVWIIVPIVLVGWLAKREQEWIPEAARRRWWARRIFFGSIVLAVLLSWLRPARPEAPAATVVPAVQR